MGKRKADKFKDVDDYFTITKKEIKELLKDKWGKQREEQLRIIEELKQVQQYQYRKRQAAREEKAKRAKEEAYAELTKAIDDLGPPPD